MVLGIFTSVIAWSQMTLPPSGNNQKSEVTQYLGLVKVTVTYNSPNVEGREIWGKLVPFGLTNLNFAMSTEANPSPWRAGANENTTISFSNDVEIEGKPLKAGLYGFHIIPGTAEATIIFSNTTNAWGSFFYLPSQDALRVTVKPVPCEFNEWLTYEFVDRQQNSATAQLKWEKTAVPFKITVSNGDDLYLRKLRDEMVSSKGFSWQNAVSAANWCATKKVNLDEASGWVAAFTNPPRNVKYYPLYQSKGNLLAAMGKTAEADATMKEAITLPDATAQQISGYGRSLLVQKREKDAMVVFETGYKRYPAVTAGLMGMARGYAANGDFKKALKFAQDALKNETEPGTKTNIEGMIKKLEKGETIN